MNDLKVGPLSRVRGEAGVFYADRAAEGVVLNMVEPHLARVALDDGSQAVVPVSALTVSDR